MERKNKFPEMLRMLLKEHDITQAEFGKILGLKPNSISTYCTGNARPDLDNLLQIASYFGVSTDYLLTGENPENKITREELGLSERALELLYKVAHAKENDRFYNVSDYADKILSCIEFYCALEECEIVISDLYQKIQALGELDKDKKVQAVISMALEQTAESTGYSMANFFRVFYKDLLSSYLFLPYE